MASGGRAARLFLRDNELNKKGARRAAETQFSSICIVSQIEKSLTAVQFTLVLVIFLPYGIYNKSRYAQFKVVLNRLL